MTTSQTNLRIVEEFSRLKALADRSDKIDRERVYGRVTFANFDAIARCVNSHDDLLAALQKLVDFNHSDNYERGSPKDKAYKAARAAIKKAEGL